MSKYCKVHGEQTSSLKIPGKSFCFNCIADKISQLGLEPLTDKPEVDWANVPVDTKVLVMDDEYEDNKLLNFITYVEGAEYPFITYDHGEDSKNGTSIVCWKFCQLAEDE